MNNTDFHKKEAEIKEETNNQKEELQDWKMSLEEFQNNGCLINGD